LKIDISTSKNMSKFVSGGGMASFWLRHWPESMKASKPTDDFSSFSQNHCAEFCRVRTNNTKTRRILCTGWCYIPGASNLFEWRVTNI